jgi:hypothetical protein
MSDGAYTITFRPKNDGPPISPLQLLMKVEYFNGVFSLQKADCLRYRISLVQKSQDRLNFDVFAK